LLAVPACRADRQVGKPGADHEPEQDHAGKRDERGEQLEVHIANRIDQRTDGLPGEEPAGDAR
jgi:hypothetical protein